MMSIDAITAEILKVVPSMMRAIKKKWKNGQISGVTNSQFHLLMFIQNNPGTSLQDVAQYLGLTSPSASATVDELVSKQLVLREPSTQDRRKITLTLTGDGHKALQEISEHSQKDLGQYLTSLSAEELAIVLKAFQLLEPLFSVQRDLDESTLSEKLL
jgi:DNA-binding MarR family transcriptional regulator